MKLLILSLATLLLAVAATTSAAAVAAVPVDNDGEAASDHSLLVENKDVAEVANAADDVDADDEDEEKDGGNDADVNEDVVKDDIDAATDEQVDMRQLVEDLVNLHESAFQVIQRVETTLIALEPYVPHSIRRRQTTVDGTIERGELGDTRGRLDVNHRRGNTVYNANVSRGRQSGTRWGAGVSHSSPRHDWGVNVSRDRFSTSGSASYRRGNSVFDANVSRNRFGTSGSAGYGRTWNNGRTSLSGSVNHDRWSGTSGGLTFRHRF